MKHLFDSSAIFKAIKNNAVEVLAGNCTLELARYELGNILWKEHTLHRRISDKEVKELIKLVREVLSVMNVVNVNGYESKVLDVAIKLKLTFYDASYVYLAKEKGLSLVTEDTRLLSKASSYLKVMRLSDVI